MNLAGALDRLPANRESLDRLVRLRTVLAKNQERKEADAITALEEVCFVIVDPPSAKEMAA